GNVTRDDLPHMSAALAAEYIGNAVEHMKCRGWTVQRAANGQGHTAATTLLSPGFEEIYGGDSREQKYARAALDGCAAELAKTAKGERNEKLNKSAFRIGTMTVRGWVSKDEAYRSLLKTLKSGLDAGEKIPHPGLDAAGAETWHSAGDAS